MALNQRILGSNPSALAKDDDNSDEGPSLGYVVRSPLGHHADGKLQATWNTRALNIVEMKMGRINSAPSPNLVQALS
jgi:hypothetical protein